MIIKNNKILTRLITSCMFLFFSISAFIFIDMPKSFSAEYKGRMVWILQPPNARVSSMGRAFAGIVDNANTVFWNPGGIIFLKNLSMEISYIPYLFSVINQEEYKVCNSAFNMNFRNSYVIGLNLSQYVQLAKYDRAQYINEYYFKVHNNLYKVSILGILFGYKKGNTGIGINTKFISSPTKYIPIENMPVAIDIGMLYSKNFILKSFYNINANIGISILNISNGIKYESYKEFKYTEGLPNIVRIGYSMILKQSSKDLKLKSFSLTHNLEYSQVINSSGDIFADYKTFGFGLELDIYEFFFTRIGHHYQKSGENYGNEKLFNGITYGMGLNFPIYYFYENLPISFSYDFGKIPYDTQSIYKKTNYNKVHSFKFGYIF